MDWSSGESEPDELLVEDSTGVSEPADSLESINYEDKVIPGLSFDSIYHPSIKDFIGQSSICDNISISGNTPLHYFDFFFNSTILQIIVEQTNLYQQQNPEPLRSKMAPWKDVNIEELRIFLGLSINMGHVIKGDLQNYWSKDPLLSTPIFRQFMTRNRYLQILRYLHFTNNEEIIDHPLRKIKPIIDLLNQQFSSTIKPGKNLCIDESLMLWKGRLKFKQFLPLKRYRFGIKLFELVDCETGFLLGFIIYTESDTDYEKFGLEISGDIVAHFLKPYFYKGHVIFMDNWCSSPKLAEFLHDRDTGMCGTVRKNRKGMPKLNSKLNRGEIEVAHTDTWLALKWLDKKEVYMITTVHEVDYGITGKKHWKTKEDIKPTCILEYNKNMGGVDDIDRQLSLTETVRKSMKWYRKFFFYLVDFVLCNAHKLYKIQTSDSLSYPDFRLQVVRGLLKLDSVDCEHTCQSGDLRFTGRHFPKKIELQKKMERKCHLCAMTGIRHRSSYECNICQVALCIDPCFEIYHTKEILP